MKFISKWRKVQDRIPSRHKTIIWIKKELGYVYKRGSSRSHMSKSSKMKYSQWIFEIKMWIIIENNDYIVNVLLLCQNDVRVVVFCIFLASFSAFRCFSCAFGRAEYALCVGVLSKSAWEAGAEKNVKYFLKRSVKLWLHSDVRAVDETMFTKSVKQNYSLLPSEKRHPIVNQNWIGSSSVIHKLWLGGDWLWVIYQGSTASQRFDLFLLILREYWTKAYKIDSCWIKIIWDNASVHV